MAKSQYTKNGYRTQQAQRFGGFRGIDLYDSPLEVNPARAVDAENFYVRGGEMHKRPGWEEVLDFSHILGTTAPIHGIFPYQNGEDSFFIVHAGAKFYRVDRADDADYYTATEITTSGMGDWRVWESDLFPGTDEFRSQGFMKDGKLYIVGAGKYLVFGKFFGSFIEPSTAAEQYTGNSSVFASADALREHGGNFKAGDYAVCFVGAENYKVQPSSGAWNKSGDRAGSITGGDNAYSNAILFHVYRYSGSEWMIGEGIDENEVNASYSGQSDKYELRLVSYSPETTVPTTSIGIELSDEQTYGTVLDDVSLVTNRRKDTAHAGALMGTGSSIALRIYTSTKIKPGTKVRVTIQYTAGISSSVDFEDFFVVLENGKNDEEEYGSNLYVVDGSLVDGAKAYRTSTENDIAGGIKWSQFSPTINFADGYIELGTFTTVNNTPFSAFYTPAADDNITIEYTAADEEEKPIDKCRFGTTFDIDGGAGRLFLSGNDDHKNADWHSALDDFTYFGDQNSAVYGHPDTPITGYVQLANNTLAVFKDAALGEPSVYYRNGSYISNDASNLRVFFTITEGALGKSALNPSVTWTFAGDSLFLAKDSVYGIVLTEKFKYDERYAKERSRTVMPQIEKAVQDGGNPTGIIKDDRLYIALGDDAGTVLMCDARQKFVSEDSVDGAFQYEWYRYTGIPAFVFTKQGGVIWFGTKSGKLARITEGRFFDRTMHRCATNGGDFSIDFSENKFIYSPANFPELKDGTALSFGLLSSGSPMALFSHVCTVDDVLEDGYLSCNRQEEDPVYGRLYDGMTVSVRNEGESGLSTREAYVLKDISVEPERYVFRLYLDGNLADAQESGFSLVETLNLDLDDSKQCKVQTVVYATNVDEENGKFQIRRFPEGAVLEFLSEENPSMSVRFDLLADNPVKAHWVTPYTSLGSNLLEKTLFALTICPEMHAQGNLTFGYDTRKTVQAMELRKVDDLVTHPFSLENFDFHNFSFGTGFAEARTFREKERKFNYIRFRFASDEAADSGINDFTVLFKTIKQYRGIS